jgi:broad specificity phosphatase PhoE
MITITFVSHSTTVDNENKVMSGHNDVELSDLGKEQAKEVGVRYRAMKYDAIFCSDLQRSYRTAEIAFGDKFPIIKDMRLREIDYGDFTQYPKAEIESQRLARVKAPFPNGESYEQSSARIKDFLIALLDSYDGNNIMIVGHRATQYGLEHWIKGIPLEKVVTANWKWQPGWEYSLDRETLQT